MMDPPFSHLIMFKNLMLGTIERQKMSAIKKSQDKTKTLLKAQY